MANVWLGAALGGARVTAPRELDIAVELDSCDGGGGAAFRRSETLTRPPV